MITLPRPTSADADQFYFTYIDQVPDGNVLEVLESGIAATRGVLEGLDASRELFRYAEGKWTLRDVVGHMADTERVFGFRAFHIGRGDSADLPGMEQDDYVAAARADQRTVDELLDELEHLRRGHLLCFRSFDEQAWSRVGGASGFPVRVSALPWIMAGHEIHHRRVIQERYLVG